MAEQEFDLAGFGAGVEKDSAPELTSNETVIDVRYTDPNGEKYEASVVSRVLTAGERTEVSRRMAREAQVPWANLPPEAALRIRVLATISVQLRNVPPWLSKWVGVDFALAYSLYEACVEHDARYLRGSAGEGTGAQDRINVGLRLALPA